MNGAHQSGLVVHPTIPFLFSVLVSLPFAAVPQCSWPGSWAGSLYNMQVVYYHTPVIEVQQDKSLMDT
ncbi:MAG: hypothetical protein MPL62_13380 [Alphaproteobacteria bacterium]|nr:hypothetical protein [Alphaproteobacteria bacterium]